MRRAFNGVELFANGSGADCAVCLGADWTAEHEMGIGALQDLFGVDPRAKEVGIVRRSATLVPDQGNILFLDKFKMPGKDWSAPKDAKKADCTALAVTSKHYTIDSYRSSETRRQFGFFDIHQTPSEKKADGLSVAWDGHGFAIVAAGERGRKFVSELHDAVLRGDIAIWVNGSLNPFGRGGLTVAIRSKLGAEVSAKMEESDRAADELAAAAKATGIREKLEAGKRGFYALAPRMLDEQAMAELGTTHPVTFFLNPTDQRTYDHGWFTVEELEAWIAGSGPIPKSNGLKSAQDRRNERGRAAEAEAPAP